MRTELLNMIELNGRRIVAETEESDPDPERLQELGARIAALAAELAELGEEIDDEDQDESDDNDDLGLEDASEDGVAVSDDEEEE
jgi:hypothetical protein